MKLSPTSSIPYGKIGRAAVLFRQEQVAFLRWCHEQQLTLAGQVTFDSKAYPRLAALNTAGKAMYDLIEAAVPSPPFENQTSPQATNTDLPH